MDANQASSVELSIDRPADRLLLIGAEVHAGAGVHFRVWAPRCKRVAVVFNDPANETIALNAERGGYFSRLAPHSKAGDQYRFRLDNKPNLIPDPASRFQPQGPHGPSQVVDWREYQWSDHGWSGVRPEQLVLQEIHIGTFTPEGTWDAAAARFPQLLEVGINCLEIMPVADFPGRFGWGYDGVNLFAPTRLYGNPDDFRRFVDRAHRLGLGVILDVVYNHLGPDGNYLKEFSTDYFSQKHKTDWGEAINFDGDNSGPVREFFLANAQHWIEEYHLDGFRFDATQNIYDDSSDHILAAITRRAREAAGARSIYLVAENEPQETRIVRAAEQGGFGMDALWNDDFHHSAMVALSGHNEAYFSDFLGNPQELIAAAKWGYLYQGQHSIWQKKRRGTPALDLPPTAFVNFIENHDQLANFVQGRRSHWTAASGRHKALKALMLLCPQTPMLFQGEEFGTSSPFVYFADHHPELSRLVRKGRREFLCQFPTAATAEMAQAILDPAELETFERCKLDWSEREQHHQTLRLHRDLLKLRREDPVFALQKRGGLDGCVLGPEAFALRFFGNAGDDRLLVVNCGRDLLLQPAPEPLLAPPFGKRWSMLWSSEDPNYEGCGTVPLETPEGFRVPGHAAVVLSPGEDDAAA
jgi:maltooligosyltrehalose trehalohydrolase